MPGRPPWNPLAPSNPCTPLHSTAPAAGDPGHGVGVAQERPNGIAAQKQVFLGFLPFIETPWAPKTPTRTLPGTAPASEHPIAVTCAVLSPSPWLLALWFLVRLGICTKGPH